jgi:8-oxo-dGTP diphosphatase
LIVKPDYKDSWVFPGGGVNKGESPKGAAVRETFEEVGINLNYKDLELAEILFDKKFDSLTLIYFCKNILDDEVKLNLQKDEIDDYQFRDATELMELLPVHYSKFIDNRLQSIITNIS